MKNILSKLEEMMAETTETTENLKWGYGREKIKEKPEEEKKKEKFGGKGENFEEKKNWSLQCTFEIRKMIH